MKKKPFAFCGIFICLCIFASSVYSANYDIKGYVRDNEGNGINGVTVELSGYVEKTYITGSDGYYEFISIYGYVYSGQIVKPKKDCYSFTPEKREYKPLISSQTAQNFTGVYTEAKEGEVIVCNNLFNPDNGEYCRIIYNLLEESDVIVKIYDLTGRGVITLVNGKQSAGEHEVKWHGGEYEWYDEYWGDIVSTGIYFVVVDAGKWKKVKQIGITKK